MAKRPSLVDVGSGFLSPGQFAANNTAIKEAFDNTLSRDGSSPNSMSADLDMNSNGVLNASRITTDTLYLNGTEVSSSTSLVSVATPSSNGLMSSTDKTKLDALVAADFGTFDGISSEDLSSFSTGDIIFVKGKATEGDLGHSYLRKVASEPFNEGKVQSSDGGWWEIQPTGGWVYDKQFGVVGDGSTDDTDSLQNAINFVVHNTAKNGVAQCGLRILSSRIRVTETIHWLYGDGTASLHVQGFAKPYRDESSFNGVAIISEVTNGFLTAIDGARDCVFENIHVVGLADAAIGGIDVTANSFTDESTWDTLLTGAGFTNPGERYNPRAAWAVDGYAGTVPGGGAGSGTEPALDRTGATNWPSYISNGDGNGYGRSTSSRIDFINCSAAGAEVAWAIGCSVDGLQGDYTTFYRCKSERCKIGVSVGQSQSRGVQLLPFYLSRFFLGVTNNTHGAQVGRFASDMHLEGGNGVNVYSFGATSTLGPVECRGEMETIDRIGDMATGGSEEHGIKCTRMKFNFKHESEQSFPANVLDCNNSSAPWIFDNCIFTGFGRAFAFANSPNAQLVNNCRTIPETPSTATTTQGRSERIFHNGTAGFLADPDVHYPHSITAQPYSISTGSAGTVQTYGRTWNQIDKDYCIPFHCRNFAQPSSIGDYWASTPRPHRQTTVNHTTMFASASLDTDNAQVSGGTWTGLVQSQAMQRGGQIGDAIYQESTGTILRLDAIDYTTKAATFQLLNNKYISDADREIQGDWTISTAYALNDVVKSTTDGQYYICTLAGTSAGDDSDLAGGSDTGVTWTNVTWALRDTSFTLASGSSNTISLSVYAFKTPLYVTWTASSNSLSGVNIDGNTTSASVGAVMGETAVGDAVHLRPARHTGTTSEAAAVLTVVTTGGTPSFTMTGTSAKTLTDVELSYMVRSST